MGQAEATQVPSKTFRRAVVFADLVAYSHHMATDQRTTLRFMQNAFGVAHRISHSNGGSVVKTLGDGILALFEHPQQAVTFATDMQAHFKAAPGAHAFRVGINFGEVVLDRGDVFGHAVNVAARLQTLSKPGGICISREAVKALDDAEQVRFTTLGPQRLYNLPGTYEPFQLAQNGETPGLGDQANRLHLSVIGGLRLHSDGVDRPLPGTADARVLLAYLALAPNCSEGLGRLGALLQPDGSPKVVRDTVDAALAELRACVGPALLVDSDVVSIDNDMIQSDIDRIVHNTGRGFLDHVLVSGGDWVQRILPNLDKTNSAVASWLALMRSDVREKMVYVLETELQRIEADTDPALRNVARAILNIEPCHEGAARRLMLHLWAAGNPGGANRVLETLARNLETRFGLTPRPETKAAARGETVQTQSRQDAMAPLRIQVRSFKGPTEAANARLSSFRSEIVEGLSRFRSWSVVEGDQGMTRQNATDYILNARQADDDGHATLELSTAETGRVIWSEALDIDPDRMPHSRQQAVGRIAALFEIYVSTDRAGVGSNGYFHTVVDDWLKGERLLTLWTKRAFDQAIDLFEALIERAPDFAPAHASLASALNVLHVVRPGMKRSREMSRRAVEASDIAVELDPMDARNRLALAWSSALKGNFDRAAFNMDMAERLNPNSPRTLASCAMGFSFLGEHKRAGRVLEHCLTCAPYMLDYQWCYAASVRFLAGDDEGALQAAARSGDRIIDNPGWTAAALARLGRLDEAREEFDKLVEDVSVVWDRKTPPSPEDVRDWFVGSYPIWHEAERDALSDALSAAMTGGSG